MKFFMFLFAFILPDLLSAEVGKKSISEEVKMWRRIFPFKFVIVSGKVS